MEEGACAACRAAAGEPKTKKQCLDRGCAKGGRCFDNCCRHTFGDFTRTCKACREGRCGGKRTGREATCSSCRSLEHKERNRACEAARRDRRAADVSSAKAMLTKSVNERAVAANVHAQSQTAVERVRRSLRTDGGGANETTTKPNVLLGSAVIGSTVASVVLKSWISHIVNTPEFRKNLISEVEAAVASAKAPLTPLGYQDNQRSGCVFLDVDDEEKRKHLEDGKCSFVHGEDGCPFSADWLRAGEYLRTLRAGIATWLSLHTSARRDGIDATVVPLNSPELRNIVVALPAKPDANVDVTTLTPVYGMHRDKSALFGDNAGEWIVGVNLCGTAEITMAHGATLVKNVGTLSKKPNLDGYFQEVHRIMPGEIYAMHHTVQHSVAASADRLALVMRPLVYTQATRVPISRERNKRQRRG